MASHIRHFAIQADQVERARAFYASAFGWRFEAWGPPDFYLIHTGPDHDPGLPGALQQRSQPLDGAGARGFECTIGVDDLGAALERITEAGGTVVSDPFVIAQVGTVAYIHDTEGNRVGVMQYV